MGFDSDKLCSFKPSKFEMDQSINLKTSIEHSYKWQSLRQVLHTALGNLNPALVVLSEGKKKSYNFHISLALEQPS